MRRLGLFSIAALGVNTIVGSGIFSLPAELARAMGASSWVGFVAAALILAVVAIAFAVAGRHVVGDGGAYLYASKAFGRVIGMIVGVGAFVATVTTWSAVCAAIPAQLAELVPGAYAQPRVVATALVLVLGLANARGVRAGAWVSNVLVVAKLLPLLAFVVVGLFYVDWSRLGAPTHVGLGAALLPAFFSLSGFETSAIPGGSADRPTRNVPLAVLGSLAGATVLYVLIQIVVIGVAPGSDAGATSARPLVDTARVFFGDAGASAMAALAVVSMLGLAAAMALAGARLCTALAPGVLTDRSGVAFTTALAALGTILVDFAELVDFTSYLLFLQYGATLLAAPVLAYRARRA